MRVFTASVIDTEKYTCQKLFDMEAESPLEVLLVARERLESKGVPVTAPLCLDVRPLGEPPMNMTKRYGKIYGALLAEDAPPSPMFAATPGTEKWLN